MTDLGARAQLRPPTLGPFSPPPKFVAGQSIGCVRFAKCIVLGERGTSQVWSLESEGGAYILQRVSVCRKKADRPKHREGCQSMPNVPSNCGCHEGATVLLNSSKRLRSNGDFKGHRGLKIRVSAVRFCPWAPLSFPAKSIAEANRTEHGFAKDPFS